jgi:Sporulation and spore germination
MRPRFHLRAAAAALAALALVAGGCRRTPAPAPAQPRAAVEPTPAPTSIVLYFPGDDTFLHRETRDVPELPTAVESRVRLLVSELLAGSRQGWAAPFPWPVSVKTVFADKSGDLFLDLSSPPPDVIAGTEGEVALTYATVNTVIANCPGIERVQLLFGGHEIETFGHLDLSRPLAAAPALVAP